VECWQRAKDILDWIEGHFDLLAGKMFKTSYGEEQDLVTRMIERAGGSVDWSVLLRKASGRMDSNRLRAIVQNLKEQGLVTEANTALGHTVTLRGH
jgi:hypothetical protein